MFKKISSILTALVVLASCQVPPSGTVGTSNLPPTQAKTGPVTIEGNCEQRTTDGYRDKISISVKDNVINALDWTANPRAGSCRFELKDFKQVSVKPNADLQSTKDKKCHIYVWQDGRHITVAVYGCKKVCKQNDRILPVLLEPKTGACKPAGNDNLGKP